MDKLVEQFRELAEKLEHTAERYFNMSELHYAQAEMNMGDFQYHKDWVLYGMLVGGKAFSELAAEIITGILDDYRNHPAEFPTQAVNNFFNVTIQDLSGRLNLAGSDIDVRELLKLDDDSAD